MGFAEAFWVIAFIVIIVGAAVQSWRDAYYERLEVRNYRRRLRMENRAHGQGGMMDWDGGFYD